MIVFQVIFTRQNPRNSTGTIFLAIVRKELVRTEARVKKVDRDSLLPPSLWFHPGGRRTRQHDGALCYFRLGLLHPTPQTYYPCFHGRGSLHLHLHLASPACPFQVVTQVLYTGI